MRHCLSSSWGLGYPFSLTFHCVGYLACLAHIWLEIPSGRWVWFRICCMRQCLGSSWVCEFDVGSIEVVASSHSALLRPGWHLVPIWLVIPRCCISCMLGTHVACDSHCSLCVVSQSLHASVPLVVLGLSTRCGHCRSGSFPSVSSLAAWREGYALQ